MPAADMLTMTIPGGLYAVYDFRGGVPDCPGLDGLVCRVAAGQRLGWMRGRVLSFTRKTRLRPGHRGIQLPDLPGGAAVEQLSAAYHVEPSPKLRAAGREPRQKMCEPRTLLSGAWRHTAPAMARGCVHPLNDD